MYNDNFRPTRLYMKKIENENKELKEQINKTIDYINEELIPYGDEWHWDSATIGDMVNELLDILKGGNKE